jgi:hypothetical protein
MSFKDNHKRADLQIEVERYITPGLPAVDRAIEYVRTRSKATSSELHIVMDLPDDEDPSMHLADAMEDERLVKAGKFWTLGAASMSAGGLIDVVEVEAA